MRTMPAQASFNYWLSLRLRSLYSSFSRSRAMREWGVCVWLFTALVEIAVLLTIGIVVVAHQRLSLYETAYGFTMLRLYSQIFAIWIAIVFALSGSPSSELNFWAAGSRAPLQPLASFFFWALISPIPKHSWCV